ILVVKTAPLAIISAKMDVLQKYGFEGPSVTNYSQNTPFLLLFSKNPAFVFQPDQIKPTNPALYTYFEKILFRKIKHLFST
nr:hypothetical protein [Saprospiraceae bacterium]